MMIQMGDPVNDRVPHIDIRARHIDLRAEHAGAVLVSALLHFREELQILLNGAVTVRTVFAGFLQSTAVLPDLVRRQVADESKTFLNKKHCLLIHDVKIVRCEVQPVLKIRPEPSHIRLDGLHEFRFFLCRIRIVKSEIEFAVELLSGHIIKKDRLRVPDVQVAVRLGREARHDVIINAVCEILFNKIIYKILCCVGGYGICHSNPLSVAFHLTPILASQFIDCNANGLMLQYFYV